MSLKRFIMGTALEGPARSIYRLLRGGRRGSGNTEWEIREARDNALVRDLLVKHLKRDSNCIDVGSHAGFFLKQFLELAPAGRHWAFEPIPVLAGRLRRGFPGVEIHECALSDHEGEATFQYVPELPGWSGLRRQPYPIDAKVQEIPVKLRRLDAMIPTDVPVAFLKIDVEGAELEVLRGAEKVLRNQRPIVYFECGKIHHTSYPTTPGAVHAWLTSCGMGVYLLDRTGPLSVEKFTEIYEASHRSGYDRNAHGNYLAIPRST